MPEGCCEVLSEKEQFSINFSALNNKETFLKLYRNLNLPLVKCSIIRRGG
jgi:hypothetical protein